MHFYTVKVQFTNAAYMQESCPPPRTPPALRIAGGGGIGAVPSFTKIRNLAALNPRLKVDRILGATVAATPVLPDPAQPVQQGIAKGILTDARHVEREPMFVQRGTRPVSRDFRFASNVPIVQSSLFGA